VLAGAFVFALFLVAISLALDRGVQAATSHVAAAHCRTAPSAPAPAKVSVRLHAQVNVAATRYENTRPT
jgi:hypothetical protein